MLGSNVVMHHSSSKGNEDVADTSLEEKESHENHLTFLDFQTRKAVFNHCLGSWKKYPQAVLRV